MKHLPYKNVAVLVILVASSSNAVSPLGFAMPFARSCYRRATTSESCFAPRRALRSAMCRVQAHISLSMSAARGDACLAAAAKALGSGDIASAQENLDNARMEYIRAGVENRNELIEQIRARLDSATGGARLPKPAVSASSILTDRLRLAKLEGDNMMAEATKRMSQRDYTEASILAHKAREMFQRAGEEIAREREPLVGNLISYIQIEEERELLTKKRKAKKEREEQEVRQLTERLEEAANAVMAMQAGGDLAQTLTTTAAPSASAAATASDAKGQLVPDVCIVVDNGSSRAASTLALRSICAKLAAAVGVPVLPASLAHAEKAPISELGGVRAETLETALRRHCMQDTVKSVVIVPLFFGPTLAVTSKIPDAMRAFAAERAGAAGEARNVPGVRWAIAGALSEDSGLAALLASEVQRTVKDDEMQAAQRGGGGGARDSKPCVILVDHGSPSAKVTAVRDALAQSLSARLTGALAQSVSAASMERRAGEAYAFADPLLSACLGSVGDGKSDVVLSMLFLLPGTHAGPGGDIDQICEAALAEAKVERRIIKTRLVGELDGLIDILKRRFQDAAARL